MTGVIHHAHPKDEQMLALWREGHDTRSIANIVGLKESEVYIRLPALRERARQDERWNTSQVMLA